jgi:hypothetical protein
MRTRVETDPDFVALSRYGYSLDRVVESHPEGCPDRMIAAALMISEVELESIYANIVQKLRDNLKIN